MKARTAVLALCAASAALRADGPDWFDAFRGRAFLQTDASFVAREKSAPPDSAPAFRVRWVMLRFAGFTERERRFWPYRNLLLVTMPAGTRYVLESSLGFVDESHIEEERPWQRVASVRTAFEVWSGGEEVSANTTDAETCVGTRKRVRAPGGTLEFFLEDFGSRTVRASLAEIAAGTFDEVERRDLAALLKVSLESNRSLGTEFPVHSLRDPLVSAGIALRDQVPPRDKRTLVFAPDPAPPGDLAAWRGFAHLPLDLPPFPPLPQEDGVK